MRYKRAVLMMLLILCAWTALPALVATAIIAVGFKGRGILTRSPALSVSGVAIYALRLGRELKLPRAAGGAVGRSLTGMGRWRWLALAAVLTAFVMPPTLFAQRA